MRIPARRIVIDSNIILSAVLGRAGSEIIVAIALTRELLVSERTIDEVLRVIDKLKGPGSEEAENANRLADELEIVPHAEIDSVIDAAGTTLRHAVPSRNGSEKDDHVLATAWLREADIWSHDRDFAGTGWPVWSSANLKTALEII